MSDGISKYGWTGLDWSFGDNNELTDVFYLQDADQAEDVLELIFGSEDNMGAGNVYKTLQHYRFGSFYAVGCNVLPLHDKSVQAPEDDDGRGDWKDAIQTEPRISGGLKFHIKFAPLLQSGYYTSVSEQAADFSAQIMSVISNAPAQDPDKCLLWSKKPGQVKADPCTNLRGIMKVVPKLEFYQKRIFCAAIPNDTQLGLIGAVNSDPFIMLDKDSHSQVTWEPGTVMLQSMPLVRKVRYDGTLWFDIAMKFSALTIKDKLEDGSIGSVTWQRLYHVDKSYWDKVTWADESPLYPSKDLNQLY